MDFPKWYASVQMPQASFLLYSKKPELCLDLDGANLQEPRLP